MNILDIIILIFLTFVIIYAISFNLNETLNAKLSNIAVNIPPIAIPTPQITVKIQKANGLNDSYDVFIENPNVSRSQQTVSLSPIPVGETIENFQSVHHDTELQQNVQSLQQIQNNPYQIQQSKPFKQIQENIVEQPITTQAHQTFNKEMINTCKPASAYGNMYLNAVGVHDYPICSNDNYENILSDDRSYDQIVDEYRKYQQYVKTNLEDPVIRGYNVNDYDNSGSLLDIGTINLKNKEIQPRPDGYVFQNSPAYGR